ncbi:13698_t:CDS:2 [Funneliformis caledonium]|uniref:13698_t:CDS:1 n=1 Tax=Funneliformis caledonium TaxID=1117310 RepID=A0A9N8ZD02_9GLOM|nr:13698_t:CDS:2 [Funneliformis caledonium]
MGSPIENPWIQSSRPNQPNVITLFLEPINDTFQPKRLTLVEGGSIKIGRMTNKGTTPTESNGYFDSKVLSRNHAEVNYHNNQVFIKDLKSSNGTFINGKRLSAEGKESNPIELRHGDDLEFGVDIINEQDKKLLFRKVAAKVCLSQPGGNIYDPVITGVEHHKITNGHTNNKRRGVNSLFAMLEAELENARSESQYLAEIGSMLNDANNTVDARSKRTPSDKVIDFRFYEESRAMLEEARIKLRETEVELNKAIFAKMDYKEKFMVSEKNFIELKQRYIVSENRVTDLEQRYTSSEKKIGELEQTCTASEQKCKESNQKVIELEDKCRVSESKIHILEDALQSTVSAQSKSCKFDDLEERLTKATKELSDTQFTLDKTRDQLKKSEKELHASQKKYNDAKKTIKDLRSGEDSFEHRNEEKLSLLSRIQSFEEASKKSDSEFSILREQLKKAESLNKILKEEVENLQEQFEMRVEEEISRRLSSSQGGLWRRHKKQESEPVKEGEMTDERAIESMIFDDKKSNKKSKKSILIKGSIGIVVLGIGTWCLSKFYS